MISRVDCSPKVASNAPTDTNPSRSEVSILDKVDCETPNRFAASIWVTFHDLRAVRKARALLRSIKTTTDFISCLLNSIGITFCLDVLVSTVPRDLDAVKRPPGTHYSGANEYSGDHSSEQVEGLLAFLYTWQDLR